MGCVSQELSLYTVPHDAKVYAKPVASGKRVLLGSTPLKVNTENIEQELAGGGPVYVEFVKEGYFKYRVYITELSNMSTNLSVELEPKTGLEDQEVLNSVIESMFESQRLAKAKRYDHALEELDHLQQKAPFLASIYEMKGGIYYIKQQYRAAYDNYQKAIKFNPKSADARRMVGLLKSTFGFQHDIDPMDIDVERLPAEQKKKQRQRQKQRQKDPSEIPTQLPKKGGGAK